MDESKLQTIRFLEKELKTYAALSLFFSTKGISEHVSVESKRALSSPTFYKERMKEVTKLVADLRK